MYRSQVEDLDDFDCLVGQSAKVGADIVKKEEHGSVQHGTREYNYHVEQPSQDYHPQGEGRVRGSFTSSDSLPCQPRATENVVSSISAADLLFIVNTGRVRKCSREFELDEVRQELSKPLLSGDKVLMTMMYLPVKYGLVGEMTKIVGFFDDGSNCSVVKNSVATKLGLWGENVTLELGTVNATTTTKTKLYCVELVDM